MSASRYGCGLRQGSIFQWTTTCGAIFIVFYISQVSSFPEVFNNVGNQDSVTTGDTPHEGGGRELRTLDTINGASDTVPEADVAAGSVFYSYPEPLQNFDSSTSKSLSRKALAETPGSTYGTDLSPPPPSSQQNTSTPAATPLVPPPSPLPHSPSPPPPSPAPSPVHATLPPTPAPSHANRTLPPPPHASPPVNGAYSPPIPAPAPVHGTAAPTPAQKHPPPTPAPTPVQGPPPQRPPAPAPAQGPPPRPPSPAPAPIPIPSPETSLTPTPAPSPLSGNSNFSSSSPGLSSKTIAGISLVAIGGVLFALFVVMIWFRSKRLRPKEIM